MRRIFPLLMLLFGSCSEDKSLDAAMGLTCGHETAYQAATSELKSMLKHPLGVEFTKYEDVNFLHMGDTLLFGVSCEAPNDFGVKDRIELTAQMICRHDSLYWFRAIVPGRDSREVEGKPVSTQAQVDRMMKEAMQ